MKRLSDLFGRYSLPSVMGRAGHGIANWFRHDGGGEPGSYPISQVGGLTQQPFTTYNGYSTSGFTNPNVGGDPYTAPAGGNPFVNSQGGGGSGGGGATQQYDPFSNFTGGFGGNSSGGTLGGGVAVDPSQWGSFGIGGDSGPASGGIGQGYAVQMMSGGMHEGGGIGAQRTGLYARMHGMGTGGALPPQGYNSSGINPGGMYTGGNAPAQPMSMGMGGNLPPQSMLGRLGGKQPPGGLMR